ncbi:MAG: GNAT family protein [Dermatophilus congolensis]|nr:GNAT family protein [Dermatophilus congolensis]
MVSLSPEAGWERIGERVRVHTPTTDDLAPYALAVEGSRERLKPWNPVDPKDLGHHLRNQSDRHRTFLIRALHPEGAHDIVGKVNVTGIQRGRALSATLGYDSYDPYAGEGLFTEGLRLVVQLAFSPSPHGLGLHRLEACVQPGNTASAGVLRRLGFTRRGAWPRYLWLGDADAVEAWRDHVVYGVTREEWPAAPYQAVSRRGQVTRPLVVLLASEAVAVGAPVHELVARGRRLALELGVPLVRDLEPAGHVTEAGAHELALRIEDAVSGAVVLTSRPAADIARVLAQAASHGVETRGARFWPVTAVRDEEGAVRVALDAVAAGATAPS